MTAGADRRVAIDGLAAPQLEAITAWANGVAAVRPTAVTAVVADRLVELGAIEPAVPAVTTVGLVTDAAPTVTDDLIGHLQAHGLSAMSDGPADAALTLLVRSGATWPEPPADAVHLGVDLTLDHTVVIGPLVVPGVSCCVQCAAGRASHRWGTPTVPPRPRIVARLAVVAALVAVQVELATRGRSPLVNATVAWDLEHGVTDRQHAYKLPGCPRCDSVPPLGRVGLPWAPAASA
ncbi:MAG: hypothetical protein HKN41_00770 [Ilumatobacter sp.]|nr:hypothetical protein [Ilumatobacter sp.]